jgi:hypothetical protein
MTHEELRLLRLRFEMIARAAAAGAFPTLMESTYTDALVALRSGSAAQAKWVMDAREIIAAAGEVPST